MSNLFLYWIVAATSSLPLPPPFKPFPRRWMAQKSDQKSQLQNAGLTDMAIGFSHAIVSTSRFFFTKWKYFEGPWQFFSMLRVLWSWLQYIHLSQVVYTCSGLCPTTFLTNAWPNLKKRFMGGLNLLHPNLANLHCQKKATWIITGMAHEFMVCHRLSWKDMPHTPTNQAIPVRDHTSIDEWNAFLLCRILLHSSVPAAHRWQMAHWSKNRSNSTLPKQTHVNSAGQGGPTLALVTPRRQDLHHSNHCRSETCQADIFLWTGLARDWEGNRGSNSKHHIHSKPTSNLSWPS